MRLLSCLGFVVLLAACGGQDTAEPCVWRLDMLGGADINVGAQKTLEAKVSTRSGTCTGHENVTWTVSNTNRLEILSSTDSTAVIRGKGNGIVTVTAFLTRITNVRDSAIFNVVTLGDQ